jgi:hypothetical protein
MLLYSGPGMMRSLTTILAVEAATLGLGLWTASYPGEEVADALRRRWLAYLGSLVIATAFAAAWSLVQRLESTAAEQGLGLAFLAALPLYACGGLLGLMGRAAASDADLGRSGVGGPAAVGAAVGFASTGLSLTRVFTPASLLLTCLVVVSAGGLIQGAILDERSGGAEGV